MMYGDGWGWGWGVMMFMPLVWIALLGVIVWAAVRLAHPGGRAHVDGRTPPRETPQEILDRRFASGEIDADTYAETRARLAGREPGSS